MLSPDEWFTTSKAPQYEQYSSTAPGHAIVCGRIHGSFHPAEVADMVATTDDYIKAYRESDWRAWLELQLRSERIVFVGYSLRDFTTWTSYFSSILDFPKETLPHALVSPSRCEHERKFWSKYHIQYVPLMAYEFLIALHFLLGSLGSANNATYAAAACWKITIPEARVRLAVEHANLGYPDLGLTIQRIIRDLP